MPGRVGICLVVARMVVGAYYWWKVYIDHITTDLIEEG